MDTTGRRDQHGVLMVVARHLNDALKVIEQAEHAASDYENDPAVYHRVQAVRARVQALARDVDDRL